MASRGCQARRQRQGLPRAMPRPLPARPAIRPRGSPAAWPVRVLAPCAPPAHPALGASPIGLRRLLAGSLYASVARLFSALRPRLPSRPGGLPSSPQAAQGLGAACASIIMPKVAVGRGRAGKRAQGGGCGHKPWRAGRPAPGSLHHRLASQGPGALGRPSLRRRSRRGRQLVPAVAADETVHPLAQAARQGRPGQMARRRKGGKKAAAQGLEGLGP
jgi:hypothetical protein